MDLKEFIDAGIYDPGSPQAAERLALLEWMLERGITVQQIIERGGRAITGLAGDLRLRAGRTLTARQIATRVGAGADEVLAVSLAAGLPCADPDEIAFTEGDMSLFTTVIAGASFFGKDATRRFARVIGSSLSRMAEAAVVLFQSNIEQPLLRAGESEVAIAKDTLRAIEAFDGVKVVLDDLFDSHLELPIRRLREARLMRMPDTVRFAVGFVDLVGFTSLTRTMSDGDLAELVERFEDVAYDVVAASDGRVVKLIGDEVMFVTRDRASACRIALNLFDRFAGDSRVTPRGAIAYGEMLLRSGDYYGPIVNLSSRIAQIAVPAELLVTSDVAGGAAASDLVFEPAGKRMLKGFDQPVNLFTVARAPTDAAPAPISNEEHR